MTLWLNIGFAWIALILAFLLVVIWGLRLVTKKKKIEFLQTINRSLRRHHKTIGYLLIATALIHGLFSGDKLLSINWGTGGFIIDDMIAGRITPPTPVPQQTEQITASLSDTQALEPLPTATPTNMPSSSPSTANSPTPIKVAATPAQTQIAEPTASSKYIDGTYQGTGVGYGPGLVVEVVIENDLIISVTVIEHHEQKEKYWGKPVKVVPQCIIETQSTDVDTISGATRTSNGIIEAVNDALQKALR